MRPFTIEGIKRLIPIGGDPDFKTGDPWLDERFLTDVPLIGHTNPYYRWFYLIAQTYRPEFTVELGSWRATAAAHFAAGNPKGTVITIDIHREDKLAQQMAREADVQYPNLHYVNAWTRDAVPVVKGWGKPIDILYIDAWHRYDDAMEEWTLYSPLLNSPALVIADDIFDQEGATIEMVRFWKEISAGYESHLEASEHLHKWVPMGVFKYER